MQAYLQQQYHLLLVGKLRQALIKEDFKMKLATIGIVAMAVMLAAGSASAVPYLDVDIVDAFLTTDPGGSNYVTGTLNVVGEAGEADTWFAMEDSLGYSPGDPISSAQFSFFLLDDFDDAYELSVVLPDDPLPGQNPVFQFNLPPPDGPVAAGALQLEITELLDGMLDWEIQSISGDFTVKAVALHLETVGDGDNAVVPELGSFAIWGVLGGVFGLGCWFRRRRRIPS